MVTKVTVLGIEDVSTQGYQIKVRFFKSKLKMLTEAQYTGILC